MDRKKQLKLVGTVVFLILLTEVLVFNRSYLVWKFSNLEQQRMHLEDGELDQLSYQDGVLVSHGIDPSITFSKINQQVASISITCDNSIATASGQVFYRSGDQPFSLLNSFTYKPSLDGGTTTLSFPNTQFIADLRVDPTSRQGDVITCGEFVLNPPPQFHLALTRLALYVCLLSLTLFELFKGTKHGQKYSSNEWLLQLKKTPEKIPLVFHDKGMLLLPITWILLWLLPWAEWLDTLPWVRLAISLLVFIVPGMILSLLLTGARFSLQGHFSAGLALSVFLVGGLGFMGRVFHWPFGYINNLFALSGLISILVLIKYSASSRPLYKPARVSGRYFIFLLFIIAFGILTNLHSRLSVDDLSYLAYVTNWQHAQQLDFREVLYGVGTADSIRFWWGMFPMSMALLTEISHLHGLLLIGLYLEPFLVAFAILALHTLYGDLLKSEDEAIAASLLHFTFIFLIPPLHRYFFEELSQDKVFAVFALAPVFFLAFRCFLETLHWRSGLFFFLIGVSLALTHPIILAYSGFIVGVYAAIEAMKRREYKQFGVTSILLIILIAPSASLRFIDEAWITRSIFGLTPLLATPDTFHLDTALETPDINNLISYIEDTPFYGLNLEKIRITSNGIPTNPLLVFLSRSYLWVLGLGFLWSLFNLKKDVVAPFIAASSLLVILSTVPYTGWLVGYFVSARLLWRVLWMLPIGLMCFVLLRDLFIGIENRIPANTHRKTPRKDALPLWLVLLCIFLVGYFSEFVYQYRGYQGQSTISELDGYRNHLTTLTKLGNYLENHIERPSRFIAPYELMYYLPGISSKSKAVIFRIKDWTPYPVDATDIDSVISDNPSISLEQRLQILDKYQVQYIVMDQPSLEKYYARFPKYFELQYTDGYWLFKFLAYQEKGND